MKTITTIDFDIIMEPSIELYNDLLGEYYTDATNVKQVFSFVGQLPANLELYKKLTLFISKIDKEKIHWIENHHEILSDINEKINLINIDHHHDINYDEDEWKVLTRKPNEGNWVKRLYELRFINKYIWLKDYESIDLDKEYQSKYISELHFFEDYDLNKLIEETDELFICSSYDWIPEEYHSLFELWEEMFKIEEVEEE